MSLSLFPSLAGVKSGELVVQRGGNSCVGLCALAPQASSTMQERADPPMQILLQRPSTLSVEEQERALIGSLA